MARDLKTVTKRLRFTEARSIELDTYLVSVDLTFTEFVSDLIKEKLHGDRSVNLEKKSKTKKDLPKADPEVLFQIGKIGNNLNQIARSLNILKNSPQVREFSFLECFYVLSQMQKDLHDYLGELPKIERSPKAIENARERAIKKRKGDDVL